MDDKLQLFYNSLTANPNIKGLPGDYDIFRTTLTDPAKSELFYNSLKANQNIKGLPESYDEFVSGLALRSGGITPKEPEQTEQQRPGFFEGLGKKFSASVYGTGEGITEAPQFGEAVKQFGVKTLADAYINRLAKKGKISAEQAEAEKKRTDSYIPKIDFLGIPHKAGTELPGTKMADSKANKWLSETSDKLSKEGERYDKRVVDYLSKGQIGKAVGAEIYGITESLAPTLLAAFGGPVGAGALGVMTGAQTYDEVKDREDMQEAAKIIDGLSTGVFEALFEYLGTAEMTKILKNKYKQHTKKEVEEALKGTVGGLLSKAYKRFGVWLAPVHEGLSEGLTTLGQNLTAKFTGEDPDRKIFDNFIESILIGMGMGGLFAGTEKGLEKLADKFKRGPVTPMDQGPAPIGELKVPHTQEEAVELINNIGRDFKFGDTPLEEDPNPVVSFGLTKLGQKVILKKEGGINGDSFFIAFDLETNEPLIIKTRDIQERKDIPYQEWVNNELRNYNIVKAEGDKMTAQMEAPVQEGQEITIKDKNFYVSQVTPEGIALNEIDEEGNITGAILQVAPDQYGSVFGMDEGIQEDDNLPENELPQATNEGIQAAPGAQAPQAARTLTVGKTNYQAVPDETGVLTIDQVFTDETTAKNTLKALEKGYPKASFSLNKKEFEDFLTPDEYKITIQPKKAVVKEEKPVVEPILSQKEEVKSETPSAPDETAPVEAEMQEAGEVEKEPWQMTRSEYVQKFGRQPKGVKDERAKIIGARIGKLNGEPWDTNEHGLKVQQALAEGKQVPPEVLEEYPELAKSDQKVGQKPQEEQPTGRQSISAFKPGDRIKNVTGDVWEVVEVPEDKSKYATLRDPADGLTTEWSQKIVSWTLEKGETSPEVSLIKANTEVDPTPTDAQKEAGNAKKGHLSVQGFDISIENPAMSVRSGTDMSGKKWSQMLNNSYGYFRRTKGKDGDQIDVFLGDNLDSDAVYVIDQTDPETGLFDEHKVMMGFISAQDAQDNYLANYEPGWKGLGSISKMSIDQFKEWLGNRTRTKNPVDGNVPVQKKAEQKAEVKPKKPQGEAEFNERQIRENAEADERGKIWGFEKMPVDEYGWAKTLITPREHVTLIEPKKGHPVMNELIAAKGPNGKWASSYNVQISDRGIGSYPGIWDEPFNTKAEALSDAAADIKEWAESQLKRSDVSKTLIKELNELISAADKYIIKPKSLKKAEFAGEVLEQKPKAKPEKPSKPTKVITLKPRKKGLAFGPNSRTGKVMAQDPNSFREAALQFFVGGGRIKTQDFLDHTGYKRGSREFKQYIWAFKNDGVRLDVFNEALENSFGIEDQGPMDMINEVIDILQTYPGRGQMITALEKLQDVDKVPDNMLPPEEDPSLEYDDINGADDEIEEVVDDIMGHPEVKEIVKEYSFDGILDVDKLLAKVESDPGEFTNFPFALKKSELLKLKERLQDEQRSRTQEGQTRTDQSNQDQSQGTGENTLGSAQGSTVRTGREEEAGPAGKPELTEGHIRQEFAKADRSHLNTSRKQLLDRVLSGRMLAIAKKGNVLSAFIETEESRGAQTNYQRKKFLYMVGIDGDGRIYVNGITNDIRLGDILKYWKDNNIVNKIISDDFFNYVKEQEKKPTKPEFAGEVLDQKPGSKEYRYKMNARPFDIGTYPKEGFVKADNDPNGGFHILTYNRKLTEKERNHWSFLPLTEVEEIKDKLFEDKDGEFFVDLEWMPNYSGADVSMFDNKNQLVEKPYFMSTNDILKNIESGYWTKKKEKEKQVIQDTKVPRGTGQANGDINIVAADLKKLIPEHLELIDKALEQAQRAKSIIDKLLTGGFGDNVIPSEIRNEIRGYNSKASNSYFALHRIYDQALKRAKGYKNFDEAKYNERLAELQQSVPDSKQAIDDFLAKYGEDGIEKERQRILDETAKYEASVREIQEEVRKNIEEKKKSPTPVVQREQSQKLKEQVGILKKYVSYQDQLSDAQSKVRELQSIKEPTKPQAQELARQKLLVRGLDEQSEKLVDKMDYTILDKGKSDEIKKLIREDIAQGKVVKNRIDRLKDERNTKERSLQNRNELSGDRKVIEDQKKGMQDMFAGESLFKPTSENLQSALKPFNDAIAKAEEELSRNDQLLDEKIDLVLKGTQKEITYEEPKEASEDILSWRKAFEKAKEGESLEEIQNLYDKLKIVLNGIAQKYGEQAINDFTQLKNEIEVYAEQINKIDSELPSDNFMESEKESLPKLEDFGQKIGGARKDMEITRTARDTDSMPAWRRKYHYANADGTLNLGAPIDTSKPFIIQWSKDVNSWNGKRTVYRPVTTIDTRQNKVFNSEEEAEAYIPIYEVWKQNFHVRKGKDNYVITKTSSTGKVIEYATFPTEEEANTYMYSTEGATSLLNHKREDFSIPALDKVERTGKDWRKGKDISTEEFMETFGFRGGEFGNWVKPEERRVMLNAAYDSFMDLAELLNIPPRALSFGGELSIAFGARGRKGAAAHFEPDRAVINLTRMNGAGSLAHEWAHALDNYFGLQGAKKDYSRNEKGEVKAGMVMRTNADLLSVRGMRKELSDIFDRIVSATQEKSVTRKMGIEEKQKVFDKFQKNVQREADDLVKKFDNGVRRYQYNRKTKQREDVVVKGTPEQIKKVRAIVDKILEGKGTKPIWERIPGSKGMGKYSYISPETLALEELHKEVFGKTGLDRDGNGFYNLGYFADKMYRAKETLDKALSGESETLNVPTDFLKASREFDKSRANPYWATKIEMFARAFEYFIETKLLSQNVRADYLQYDKAPVYDAVYGKNPYPQGEERAELNKLFDEFFKTIQTKEEDGKLAMFRITGERGATAVEGLLDYLNVARQMESAGKSSKEIFLATGWERGKDGKWRHETRDIELKKGIDFISKLKTQNKAFTEEVSLTDIIEDEELFNSYPELKEVKLTFYNYGSHPSLFKGAFADFEKKVICIGTENMAGTKRSRSFLPGRTVRTTNRTSLPALEERDVYAYDRESLIANISHEIQHYIQRIEGFTEGTTRDIIIPGRSSDEIYRLSPGEVEARNVQQRTKLTSEERKAFMLSETEDVTRDQQIIIRSEFNQQENASLFRINDQIYFSPVEKALAAIKQGKATVQQWKAMLLKNGAKEAELAWMGWDDFASIFEGTSDMNKDHIQTWINQNKVEIKEVEHGGMSDQQITEKKRQIEGEFDIKGYKIEAWFDDLLITKDGIALTDEELDSLPEDLARLGREYSSLSGLYDTERGLKYSNYTMPGGEDNRELLLTLPARTERRSYSVEELGKTGRYVIVDDSTKNPISINGVDSWNKEDAERIAQKRNETYFLAKEEYQSPHWDEPNVLAHVRFNTRRTQDGKNVLFIEEIQSDWQQSGKKKGFKVPKEEDIYQLARKIYYLKRNIGPHNTERTNAGLTVAKKEAEQKGITEKELSDAMEKYAPDFTLTPDSFGVPDMPYKKTDQWDGLALRRMVRYAIDNGFDAIAWTPGEVQNERYDLSKQVDRVEYEVGPGIYPGVKSYTLDVFNKDGIPVMRDQGLDEEAIEARIGKELAQKIVNGDGEIKGEKKILSGLDLKVGGQGMTAFYDQILPSIANKLGKKFGAQAGKIDVRKREDQELYFDGIDIIDADGQTVMVSASEEQYKKLKNNIIPVHSLPITDAMFDSYRQGIPLFKRSQRLTGESLLFEVVNTPSREAWENEVRDKVKILADSLNTKIEVISNRSQLPERIQRQALRQGITTQKRISGVYDPQTDTVYVLLDDIRAVGTLRGIEEVTKTVLHEVVAHQGLPSLLGEEEYNKFLDDLYWDIPQIDRSFLMEQYNTSDHRTISEEYLGMMAEQNVNPTLFQKILAQIRQILRKLFKVNYTENDIHDMLRRSRENLNKPKASDYTSAQEYLEATDKYEKAKFRIAQAYNKNIVDQAAEVYKEKEARRTIKETKQGIREYIQDLNLPIRKFEEEVLKRGGKQDNESKPYRDTSLSFGRHEKLYNDFFDQKMKPVLNTVAKIKKTGIPGENILPYIISKHAIERNRAFREKELNDFIESHPDAGPDKINDLQEKIKDKDYSGVMAFDTDPKTEKPLGNYTNPDSLAKDIVKEFEAQIDKKLIDELWAKMRLATSATLDTWETGQQISAEQKQEYLDKFKYFVPLRGWRHGAAKELQYTKGQGFSHSLRHAEGRKSLADNPLAYILNVQFQAISEQVTNEVNNSMLNLIIRNLNNNEIHELATLKKLYYLKVNLPDGSYEWEPTLTRPTAEQFANGEARIKIFREHERLRTPSEAQEHEVIVHKPGGDIIMVFPKKLKVGQSLNKQNYIYRSIFGGIHDARDTNKVMASLGHLNNMLKAAYTSWNVVFPFTNFMRDFQEASITQAIKQGTGLKVIRNYKHAFPAIIRHLAGKTDLNNPIDKSLDEFYKVGGATGYTHLKTPEEIEKDINKEIKRMVRAGTFRGGAANTARKFILGVEYWNRIFEDATRFSVYMASLAAGNTKEDAAYDAKEASVNFNRKGKGSKAWDAYFAFFNVAIQSMQKNFALAKNYTGKFTAVAMSFVTLGFIEAMMNALFDDDEETSYYNINPYMRQNYLVIPNIPALLKGESKGDKYLSIPLPQFWRGFKSMGAIGFDIATKRMTVKDGTMQALGNFGSALLPVDIGGLWKSGEFSLAPIMPTVIKPIAEVIENRNYMGYAIKNEPFTREQKKILAHAGLGKKNVNPAAKFITDMLFRWGGGDSKYKYYYDSYEGRSKKVPGWKDINPSTVEHLFKGYTGGTGGVFSDMMTTISQGLDPEQEIDYRNAPFVNRFIRKIPEAKWNIISEYYDLRDDSNVTNSLSANYFKEGNYEKAMEVMGDEYLMKYTETFKYYESALDDAKKDTDFDEVEGNYRGIELMRQCINDIKDLKEEYGR